MRRAIAVRVFVVVVLAALVALPVTAHAVPIYVSAFGSDTTGDGLLPVTAFATVQHAMDIAASGDIVQVGAGTFAGDVTLKGGVSLQGAGSTETTLTGSGTRPVLYAYGLEATTTVTGVTLTGGISGLLSYDSTLGIVGCIITGNSNRAGGGIECERGSLDIVDSVIADNTGSSRGGGIYCSRGTLAISGSLITSNTAPSGGGGIYCYTSSLTLADSRVTGNSAVGGGGIYCEFGTLDVTRSVFTENTASNRGGAIQAMTVNVKLNDSELCTNTAGGLYTSGVAVVRSCSFNGNGGPGVWSAYGTLDMESSTVADNAGTGLICEAGVGSTISGNTITGNTNTADPRGLGGGASISGDTKFFNNAVKNNSASWAGGVSCSGSGVRMTANDVSRNTASNGGGGIYCYDSPTVSGNNISDNTAGAMGGGICSSWGRSSILNNVIRGNSAADGGGIYCISSPSISGNTISENTASAKGGAVYSSSAGTPLVVNNVIHANSATEGGGVYSFDGSTPFVSNSTVVGNTAPVGGGVAAGNPSSLPRIENSIVWDNGDDLYGCSAVYSCVQNVAAATGVGNTSAPPSFIDTETADFHLAASSPCIDVANSIDAPDVDKDNVVRPRGSGYDMGAYEFHRPLYSITATAGVGGGISTGSPPDVEEGDTATYTVTATLGFRIADVRVDGSSVGVVKQYVFKNVMANHTIEASFEIGNAAPKSVTRAFGSDRYGTAAALARKGWDPTGNLDWTGVEHIVIANGEPGKESDPLSAAGLAGTYDAPVLTVQVTKLPGATKTVITEIAKKNPGVQIHIVGGTSVVPDARWNEIKRIPGVSQVKDRFAGRDRFETSALMATRMVAIEGADAINGVILIAGDNPAAFYDALAASPVAYARTMPLLSVQKNQIPTSVKNVLKTAALKDKPRYAASCATYIGNVPAAGALRMTTSFNRYTAATQIAEFAAIDRDWTSRADTLLASKLPDALTGGAFLGRVGGVMLFTDSTSSIQSTSKTFIMGNKDSIMNGWVIGGKSVVPTAQETSFRSLLN